MNNTAIKYYCVNGSQMFPIVHIVEGVMTQRDIEQIATSLNGNKYFIPHLVGLSEFISEDWSIDDAAPTFYYLKVDEIELTDKPPTIDITVQELSYQFLLAAKNCWED